MEKRLTPLCELARLHETDKGGWHLRYGGGDSDTCHVYTPIYWDLLQAKRERVANVLEVGINAGSSLRMWRDFFPNAQVFGIDCEPRTMFTEDRITTILADQGSPHSLKQAMDAIGSPRFDLIVEDGSHELHHQIITMQTLLRYLTDDGIYVCEDMHADCHPELVGDHVPEGYAWTAVPCEIGFGKAHCWCNDCGQTGPEQLLVVRRVQAYSNM